MLMPRKINVDLTTGAIGHAQFYSRSSEVSDCEGRQGFRGLTLGPVFPFSTASTSKTASPHTVKCRILITTTNVLRFPSDRHKCSGEHARLSKRSMALSTTAF